MQNITGIILAGGKSSRMGYDKGLAPIHGTKSIEHIIKAMKPVTETILISANSNTYDYLNFPVVKDIIIGCGPAGGIYSALSVSSTEKNLVVACDTPLVTSDFLNFLAGQAKEYEIVIPVINRQLHPLCACYSKQITKQLEELLLKQIFTMRKIIKFFSTKELHLEEHPYFSPRLLSNINTPDDLQQLKTNFLNQPTTE